MLFLQLHLQDGSAMSRTKLSDPDCLLLNKSQSPSPVCKLPAWSLAQFTFILVPSTESLRSTINALDSGISLLGHLFQRAYSVFGISDHPLLCSISEPKEAFLARGVVSGDLRIASPCLHDWTGSSRGFNGYLPTTSPSFEEKLKASTTGHRHVCKRHILCKLSRLR
jgi:hypothetical protein